MLSVANAINGAISHEDLSVFLSFRDIDQANIEGPDKARAIYNHDISALKRARIVVALVDGISKDDGVAMELGYAFGLGIPVILCSSDFIVAQLESEGKPYICDPLIDFLAIRTVAEDGLNLIKMSQYEDAHLTAMDRFAAKDSGRGCSSALLRIEEPCFR
jgi:nucleoside 2-deoxyribosyltransferase